MRSLNFNCYLANHRRGTDFERWAGSEHASGGTLPAISCRWPQAAS